MRLRVWCLVHGFRARAQGLGLGLKDSSRMARDAKTSTASEGQV